MRHALNSLYQQANETINFRLLTKLIEREKWPVPRLFHWLLVWFWQSLEDAKFKYICRCWFRYGDVI